MLSFHNFAQVHNKLTGYALVHIYVILINAALISVALTCPPFNDCDALPWILLIWSPIVFFKTCRGLPKLPTLCKECDDVTLTWWITPAVAVKVTLDQRTMPSNLFKKQDNDSEYKKTRHKGAMIHSMKHWITGFNTPTEISVLGFPILVEVLRCLTGFCHVFENPSAVSFTFFVLHHCFQEAIPQFHTSIRHPYLCTFFSSFWSIAESDVHTIVSCLWLWVPASCWCKPKHTESNLNSFKFSACSNVSVLLDTIWCMQQHKVWYGARMQLRYLQNIPPDAALIKYKLFTNVQNGNVTWI